jgi:anti-sigma B factor antagonist
MTIFESLCNNITIITLHGKLDASTVPILRQHLVMTAENHSGGMVIDFSNVNFIDSSGLGALIGIARNMRTGQRDIKLACLNDNVRKVFEITRASRLFDIYDDPEVAAKNFDRRTVS